MTHQADLEARYERLLETLNQREAHEGRLPLGPASHPVLAAKRGVAHTPSLGRSEVFVPQANKGLRLIDALMIMAASAEVFWPVTRSTLEGELGWSAFGSLFGGFMYLEAKPGTELTAVGAALAASNTAYFLLRIFHPNLSA